MVMEKFEEMEKELVFRNLNISLQQKHVLKNISGVARSKEILGVFGPKGKIDCKLGIHANHKYFPSNEWNAVNILWMKCS